MNEDASLVRKLVPVLCQGQMIVALDLPEGDRTSGQALENSFHRIADHRGRTAAHFLWAITALLAPLLEP
jgi:hypothetical protein